jgi:hypothetical protein
MRGIDAAAVIVYGLIRNYSDSFQYGEFAVEVLNLSADGLIRQVAVLGLVSKVSRTPSPVDF